MMASSAAHSGRRQQLLLLYSTLELTKALQDLLEQSGQTETARAIARDTKELMASVQKEFAQMPQMMAYARKELEGAKISAVTPTGITIKRATAETQTSRRQGSSQWVPKRVPKRDDGLDKGSRKEQGQ